jgi:heme/copper-type cytochrome/quinol oxidase subunit 2
MTTATLVTSATKPRPLTPLTRATLATLIIGSLLLVYMQVFIFRSFEPPVAVIFGLPALIFIGLIAFLRRRWASVLGSLYWVLFVAANAPYLSHDLTHPEILTSFAFSIMLMLPALAGFAAGIIAAVQNYRAAGVMDVPPRIPRWFWTGLTALTALGLGAILAAAITPASASGVSAKTLASLPALATASHRFDQTELRAQTGAIVALRLDNQDASGHSFDIDEFNLHVSMPPGEPALALFTADAPGTYTFYCAVPGHREAGMVGTLIVEP